MRRELVVDANLFQAHGKLKHWAHKALVLPLLRAWHAEGIETLLFKGFYLAEFIYGQALERPYNDVDVLIHPCDAGRARALARDLGWREVWAREASLYRFSHEETNLRKTEVLIEPHRLILDTATPWHSVQRRITEAAWTDANLVDWEGFQVRVLQPVDSILMGIVLARAWSGGDDWQLKASDYCDLEMLSAAANLSQADLERRAESLHCSRTLQLFLARCNPWLGVHNPEPPSKLDKERWYVSVMPERGHLGLERLLMSASRLPGTLRDALHYGFFRTNGVQQNSENSLNFKEKERIVRGVKLAAKLRWTSEADPCIKRSEAFFAALAQAGYPVRLELGQDANGQRHARISMPGFSPRDFSDVQSCYFQITEVIESDAAKKADAKLNSEDTMTQNRFDDDTLLTLSPEQVSVEGEGETVVLGSESGHYFSLEGVGRDAWQLLREPRSFSDLRSLLLERYDVSAEVLEADLRDLLSSLLASGLVIYAEQTP